MDFEASKLEGESILGISIAISGHGLNQSLRQTAMPLKRYLQTNIIDFESLLGSWRQMRPLVMIVQTRKLKTSGNSTFCKMLISKHVLRWVWFFLEGI
jgi:hypothetical protein